MYDISFIHRPGHSLMLLGSQKVGLPAGRLPEDKARRLEIGLLLTKFFFGRFAPDENKAKKNFFGPDISFSGSLLGS